MLEKKTPYPEAYPQVQGLSEGVILDSPTRLICWGVILGYPRLDIGAYLIALSDREKLRRKRTTLIIYVVYSDSHLSFSYLPAYLSV